MTPEQEAKRRHWKLVIGRLAIGDSSTSGGVSVTRASRNRYLVTIGGVTHNVGGRCTSVLTASTRALSVIRLHTIDGQEEVELCVQCETRPRQIGRGYCRECEQVLDRGYNHKRYQRLKAEKRLAA